MSDQLQNAQTVQATTHAELRWALSSRSANVLIIGGGETVVATVQAYIAAPVTVITDDVPPEFSGTCLLRDALLLTRDQQRAWLGRLDRRAPLRLVTVSAVPLYPLVQSGHFDETLYYRLNTITVEWPTVRRDGLSQRPC